jgi:hypothetical protein
VEQGPQTAHRRKLFVEALEDSARVGRALADVVTDLQPALPGVGVTPRASGGYEVTIPAGLDPGHESHFPRVLDAFISAIDERRWPAALVERTLAKYALLAEAAARTNADLSVSTEDSR